MRDIQSGFKLRRNGSQRADTRCQPGFNVVRRHAHRGNRVKYATLAFAAYFSNQGFFFKHMQATCPDGFAQRVAFQFQLCGNFFDALPIVQQALRFNQYRLS